jgi:hypothetical protein
MAITFFGCFIALIGFVIVLLYQFRVLDSLVKLTGKPPLDMTGQERNNRRKLGWLIVLLGNVLIFMGAFAH